MKTFKFLSLILGLCACTLTLTACGDDDDDNKGGGTDTPAGTTLSKSGIQALTHGYYGYSTDDANALVIMLLPQAVNENTIRSYRGPFAMLSIPVEKLEFPTGELRHWGMTYSTDFGAFANEEDATYGVGNWTCSTEYNGGILDTYYGIKVDDTAPLIIAKSGNEADITCANASFIQIVADEDGRVTLKDSYATPFSIHCTLEPALSLDDDED